jgi:hypothetical protein
MVVAGLFLATNDRARASAAWIAAIVCAFAFVFTAPRAGYVDRNHLVPEMRVVGELAVDGPPITIGALSISLRNDGNPSWCIINIASHRGAETLDATDTPLQSCPRVRVRYDANDDNALIETLPQSYSQWGHDTVAWHVETVRAARNGAPVPLDVPRFRKRVRVPPDWVGLAAFSAACALAFLSIGRRLRSRASHLASLDNAEHEGGGWFSLSDGRRVRVPSAATLAAGTFAVRLEGEPNAVDYRTSSGVVLHPVRRGAKDEHAERSRDRASACEGVAFAFASLGAMPALAALVAFIE